MNEPLARQILAEEYRKLELPHSDGMFPTYAIKAALAAMHRYASLQSSAVEGVGDGEVIDTGEEPWSDQDLDDLTHRLGVWPGAMRDQVLGKGLPSRLDDDLQRAHFAIRWLRSMRQPSPTRAETVEEQK